jgi:hypothetical protein
VIGRRRSWSGHPHTRTHTPNWGVGSTVALPNLPCLQCLPYQRTLTLPASFTPRFSHSHSLVAPHPTRNPKHKHPTIPARPSFPSHLLARGAPRAWMDQRGRFPSAAQGLASWEIRTAMRLMLRGLETGFGMGVSACRPSARNHWLPPSQHEKEHFTREHTTSYRDVSPSFSFPSGCG